MIFRAVFNTHTLKTGIHKESCSAATPAPHNEKSYKLFRRGYRKNGSTVWDEEAPTAQAAADKIYLEHDMEERKLPRPHICKCCKEQTK